MTREEKIKHFQFQIKYYRDEIQQNELKIEAAQVMLDKLQEEEESEQRAEALKANVRDSLSQRTVPELKIKGAEA